MAESAAPGGVLTASFKRAAAWPATAAAVTAALSGLLFALAFVLDRRDDVVLSLVGYALGTLVTAVLVVLHRGEVHKAQRDLWFVPQARLDRMAALALGGGMLAGLGHAYLFATEIAKRTA
jgi:hypothetical protein